MPTAPKRTWRVPAVSGLLSGVDVFELLEVLELLRVLELLGVLELLEVLELLGVLELLELLEVLELTEELELLWLLFPLLSGFASLADEFSGLELSDMLSCVFPVLFSVLLFKLSDSPLVLFTMGLLEPPPLISSELLHPVNISEAASMTGIVLKKLFFISCSFLAGTAAYRFP